MTEPRSAADPRSLKQEDCDKTHPGFTITCNTCQSTLVYVDDTMGFSAGSGCWGSVDLVCAACSATSEIVACS